MKIWKIVLAVLMTLVLVNAGNASFAFWKTSDVKATPDDIFFEIDPAGASHGVAASRMEFWKFRKTESGGEGRIQDSCLDLSTPRCDPALVAGSYQGLQPDGSYSLQAKVIFPVCLEDKQESCIESLVVSNANGTGQGQLAKFVGYSTPGLEMKPQEKYGLPGGSTIPLFTSSGIVGLPDETKYAARFQADYTFDFASQKFVLQSLTGLVTPTIREKGSFGCVVGFGGSYPWLVSDRQINDCGGPSRLFSDADGAAYPENFPAGSRIALKIRVPSTLGGWFSGQFSSVDANLTAISPSSSRLELAADAVTVQQLKVVIPKASISEDLVIDRFPVLDEIRQRGNFAGYSYSPEGQGSINALAAIRKYAQDTSSGENTVWNFQSGKPWQGSACKDAVKGISGIVATNSMAYLGSQPIFEDGQLTYTVAGMHNRKSGGVVSGTYDLLLRAPFARCLYGFTTAPVHGKVAVTNASGDTEVATTSFSEKNGWVRLAANGFGFSQKTLAVTLSQEALQMVCRAIAKVKKPQIIRVKTARCPKGYVRK